MKCDCKSGADCKDCPACKAGKPCKGKMSAEQRASDDRVAALVEMAKKTRIRGNLCTGSGGFQACNAVGGRSGSGDAMSAAAGVLAAHAVKAGWSPAETALQFAQLNAAAKGVTLKPTLRSARLQLAANKLAAFARNKGPRTTLIGRGSMMRIPPHPAHQKVLDKQVNVAARANHFFKIGESMVEAMRRKRLRDNALAALRYGKDAGAPMSTAT